jgi:hypothetical protein
MQLADANGDLVLTPLELVRVPGLAAAMGVLDTDADGRLSPVELTAWLSGIRESRTAITPLSVLVTSGDKPVDGAVVKLVPETFMGREMKVAEATSDATGTAVPSIPEAPTTGVNSGVYRVVISGMRRDGTPIPAKYNSATTLGIAVGNGAPLEQPVVFVVD